MGSTLSFLAKSPEKKEKDLKELKEEKVCVFSQDAPYTFIVRGADSLEIPIRNVKEHDLPKLGLKWLITPKILPGSESERKELSWEAEKQLHEQPKATFEVDRLIVAFPSRPSPSPMVAYQGVICFQDIPLDYTKFLITREAVQSGGVTYHGGPYLNVKNTSLPVDEWEISSWWGCLHIKGNQSLDPNQTFDLEKAIQAWAKENKITKIPVPFEIQTKVVGSSLEIRPVVKLVMDVENVNPLELVINNVIKLNERHFKDIAEMTLLERKKREIEFGQGIKDVSGPLITKPTGKVYGTVGTTSTGIQKSVLKGWSFGFIEVGKKRINLDEVIVALDELKRNQILENLISEVECERFCVCSNKTDIVLLGVKITASELSIGTLINF
jgi:hypothetical protein